jgi:hypothetical protein
MSSAMAKAFSPEQLDEEFMKLPVYRALRKYDPRRYQEILSLCAAAAERGASMTAAIGAGREVLLQVFNAAVPQASDEVLNKMAHYWQSLVQKYGESHPNILRAIIDSKPLNGQPQDLLPDYPTETELSLMTEVFNSAAAESPTVDKVKAEADLLVVIESMEMLSVGARERFSRVEKLNDHEYVAIVGLYYRCINEQIPLDRRANLIRFLFDK